MYNTIPDHFRKLAVESLYTTTTFQNCWTTWKPEIRNILGINYDESSILNLGDHLSDIFQLTGGTGRGQSAVSAGGIAWESLVCWYMNICTSGSRVVSIKKMSLVPKPIQDAITVNYGNFACNTESDITVITFPNLPEYNMDISDICVYDQNNKLIPPLLRGKLNPALIDFLVTRDFSQIKIGIIQCKTNWNDNAQIPMLWDMIYSAGGFRGRNITIGKNSFSIQSCAEFTYSFVTVPSNRNTIYSSTSVAVKRVTNLSGGNYWGKSSVLNVAKSLKEIFTNNYQGGARTNLRDDLKMALPHFSPNRSLDYFKL